MKVTVIPIVGGLLETIAKGLIKELEDLKIRRHEEALLKSTRILRSLLEACCHSNSSEKPSANVGVKNSQRSKMMMIIIMIIEIGQNTVKNPGDLLSTKLQ